MHGTGEFQQPSAIDHEHSFTLLPCIVNLKKRTRRNTTSNTSKIQAHEPNSKNISTLVLLLILLLKQMLTSSWMQLHSPSTKHVPRHSGTSHVSTRTGLMRIMWRFKTFLIAKETPFAFGKMTLLLSRSRKNSNASMLRLKKHQRY